VMWLSEGSGVAIEWLITDDFLSTK